MFQQRYNYNDDSAVHDWRNAAALASSSCSSPMPFGAPRTQNRSLFEDEYTGSYSPRSSMKRTSAALFPPPSSSSASSSSPWWSVSQTGFDRARRSKRDSKVFTGQVLHIEQTPFGSATSHNSLGLEIEDHSSADQAFNLIPSDSRRSSYSSSTDSLPGAFSMPVSTTARSSSTSLGLAFDESEDLDFTVAFDVDEDREDSGPCSAPRLIPIAIPISPVPPPLETLSLASPRKRRATLSLHTPPLTQEETIQVPELAMFTNSLPLPPMPPSPAVTPAPSSPSGTREMVPSPPPPPPSPTLLVFGSLSLDSSDSSVGVNLHLPLGPTTNVASANCLDRTSFPLGNVQEAQALTQSLPVKRRRLTAVGC